MPRLERVVVLDEPCRQALEGVRAGLEGGTLSVQELRATRDALRRCEMSCRR